MTTKRGRSTYRPTNQPESLRDRLGSKRRILVFVGLALFLIADLVLVGLALTANGRSGETPTQRPLTTFGMSPTPTPTSTETPVAAAPTGRFLVAGSADVLWRATEGSCETPAVVERSVDAGLTWTALPTGAGIDLRVVRALSATSADELQLVGAAGADCTIDGFSSTDAGDTWESDPAVVTTAAYASTGAGDGGTTITIGGQPVVSPCPTVDVLTARDERTVAACSAVLAEWDAVAGAWVAVPFAGIHAAEVQDDQILFAARGTTGCSGLGVMRVAGTVLTPSSGIESVGCVPDADITAPATLASFDGAVWLWVGDAVFRSVDAGASWTA
ncbi:hypothetical protein KXS11_07245 [Plantibacter flavus]|uniref:hypothetical protein n=1 Tax=Plantibacter flavus TaxID=150123 RepID=UPI003F176BF2